MSGQPGGELGPTAKAAVLTEALPYIRRFSGKVVVVKYGGAAIGTEGASLQGFARDIVLMSTVGMKPVIVHGGGPQVGALMGRLGKVPEFREGLRVTDAETLDIARMVLAGKVNKDIVGSINVHGALAVGLSGEDASLIRASARSEDLGFVGQVEDVDPEILERLLAQGLIPVVATIGADGAGQPYNINADVVAGVVAEALHAEKLVYLTDVDGILGDPGDPSSLVRTVVADELEAMLEDGALSGGMIPKASSCVHAVRSGVGHGHILDGRAAHALLLEMFTAEGVGTMVTA